MLGIYDFSPVALDKRFIETLAKKLSKTIKLAGEVEYRQVDGIQQQPLPAAGPTENNNDDNNNNGSKGSEKPGGAAFGAPAPSPASSGTAGLVPMVNPRDIRTYEYDVRAVEGPGPYALATKMVIFPIELGNFVRLLKGSFLLGDLPISSLESVTAVAEKRKGLTGEKQNRKIAIVYLEAGSKADKIISQLATLRRLGVSDGYFTPLDFECRVAARGGDIWVPTRMFLTALFLAPGEAVLWMEHRMEGILSKRCRWFKAVTNFRAIFYDFDAHDGVALTLRKVDAVLVTNKRVESESQHSAQIRTLDSPGPTNSYSNYYGSSQTSSMTFGDVLIMHGGEPIIQLVSIQDPDGVAALIRHAVAESQSSMRRAADSALTPSSVAGALLRPSPQPPQSSSLPSAEVRQVGKEPGADLMKTTAAAAVMLMAITRSSVQSAARTILPARRFATSADQNLTTPAASAATSTPPMRAFATSAGRSYEDDKCFYRLTVKYTRSYRWESLKRSRPYRMRSTRPR
jgi:hypothetical protein